MPTKPPPKPRTNGRKPARPKKPASNVLRLDRKENVDKIAELVADREPLFGIGDVEYTIPKQAPAVWTMTATNLAIEEGEAAALGYAMVQMLGEAGYNALSTCSTLTSEDLDVIIMAIVNRVIPSKGDGRGPKAP